MKKSNKPTFIESDNGKKIRLCQEKGCLNEGEYEAPKSPNSKEKYFSVFIILKFITKGGITLLEKSKTNL